MLAYKTLTELFEDPAHWTKGWFWRTRDDDDEILTNYNGIAHLDDIVCCCLSGGIKLIYRDRESEATKHAITFIRSKSSHPDISVALWNDSPDRTIEEILEASAYIDQAMETM